jgi:hypothetical protein
LNKGVESGVRKYNTTNNDPSKSTVIDKSIGGVLRFFLSGSNSNEERISNTTNYPINVRSSKNLVSEIGLNQSWVRFNLILEPRIG